MFYTIYKITNNVNGKFYIGITSESLNHRFRGHVRKARHGSTTNFHQALMKHGEANFSKEILHSFEEEDKKVAYSLEQRYIDTYEAVAKGYNMDLGFGWNIIDRSGKNNPMYGKVSGNAKAIIIDGVEYESATLAGKILGKSPKTISQWARNSCDRYRHCYYK